MKAKDQISRRLEKHHAASLKTFALFLAGRVSITEVRRRNRAADREMREIRKLISKFAAIKKGKKKPAARINEVKPLLPKGPHIPWIGRKSKDGTTTHRIG